MFTRTQALDLLHQKMQNQNLRKHCYAVEAAMKALARHFKEDEEIWGIAGLLHDSDYEQTKEDTSKHAITAVNWLREKNADVRIVDAVLAHGWGFVKGCPEPKNVMEWSLYCCDELTGLIVAVALVRPDKSLASVTVESVLKKFPQKQFAAGVHREQIQLCEEKLKMNLSDFVQKTLNAMKSIHQDLGL